MQNALCNRYATALILGEGVNRLLTKTARVMQLTAILLTACCLSVTAKTVSQSITYSAKDVKLQEVFEVIKRQTGFFVFFHEKKLEKANLVTINAQDMPLTDFLDRILRDQPFSYSVQNTTITIKVKPEEKAADLSPRLSSLTAPPITGIVRDSTGAPLSGATIYNKRTKKSVQTNANGKFIIEGEKGDALTVSYVGFASKNVKLTGDDVSIILTTSDSPLDEVQVMAYGTTTKRLNPGNIATIKSEEIAKQPVDNPLLALQGRVPGLIIVPTSGLPGAAVTIQLRGQNSLTGLLTQPLVVVDGIPYSNNIPGAQGSGSLATISALRFINPGDIESIDVLKDADATAIYGSRGANGVILITTKKGKTGSTRINLNAYTGYTQQAKRIELLNTQQYLQMRKAAYINDGLDLPTSPNPRNYDLTVWDQSRYTDWQEHFLHEKGKFSSIQASVTGGTTGVQYLISGAYNSQTSLFPGHPKDQSGIVHINLTGVSNNRKLRVSLNGDYNENQSNVVDFSRTSLFLQSNAPEVYKKDGTLNWAPDPISGYATWNNPLGGLSNKLSSNTATINISTDVSYQLFKNLQLKITGGMSNLQYNSQAPRTLASQDPATMAFAKGSNIFNNNSSKSWIIEPQVIYKDRLGKGKMDVIVGGTIQSQTTIGKYLYTYGYSSDALLQNIAAATTISGISTSNEYKYNGVFGRLIYNWGEKYILSLNARRDGSSRFGPGNQFGNFGSVGAAWVFSNEKFLLEHATFLSFGKLRFSYGNSGNDNISDYKYLELFKVVSGSAGVYQGTNTIASGGVVNPNYHWESTRKLEVALELAFLKDRIIVTGAYFQNRSSDQLGYFPLPNTAGNSTIIINQPAKIQNAGLEFTLLSTNVKSKHFSWSTSANISFVRNKLLKLPKDFTGFPIIYGDQDPVGKPFAGVVPVYENRGVDPETGAYQFTDVTGKTSKEIWEAYPFAKTVTTSPRFYGGISNTLSYQGFSLDVFLQFTKQMGRNYLYDPMFLYAGGFNIGAGNVPLEIFHNSWQKVGDNATFQKFSQNSSTSERLSMARNSDVAWVDASFVRVKNLSLSYNFSNRLKQKMHVQDIRLYAQGQNLWTFTKYKGTDPETQSVSVLAPLRVVTVGLQIGL